MKLTTLERKLYDRGFRLFNPDTNQYHDDVNLLDNDCIVTLDLGSGYKVMVSYRDNQYEITDYYCTEHEMGDRSYQTDNIDQVLPVCFYFATEAKCRAQLEASFNLMSAS